MEVVLSDGGADYIIWQLVFRFLALAGKDARLFYVFFSEGPKQSTLPDKSEMFFFCLFVLLTFPNTSCRDTRDLEWGDIGK